MIAVIKWFQERKWLSSILVAVLFGASTVSLDTYLQGWPALVAGLPFGAGILLARTLPWYSIGLLVLGAFAEILFFLKPVLAGYTSSLTIFILAVSQASVIRRVAVLAVTVTGIAVVFVACFYSPLLTDIFGIAIYNDSGRLVAFALGAALVAAGTFSAFTLGRLAYTQLTHVGTETDRRAVLERSKEVELQLAEQSERLGIARDLTDLVVQDLSGILSVSEGASYAAKADPEAAVRALDRIHESSRRAHQEVRRLYDMLNRNYAVTAASPGIDALEALVIELRGLGYNVNLRHEGPRFGLGKGAELAIYRIVFDAVSNIKKNVVRGADVSIEFTWVNDGLQILIKDNGIETVARSKALPGQPLERYTASDDLAALVDTISGVGITAMRERAALYGGSIEANRVPGVGFTLSAIFPMLRTLGNSQGN